MIAPFIQGFGTGGGLIVAIGAQNAFVLSQGVRRNHHLIIALICIICDAIFISAGVAGFGKAVSSNPILSQWVTWGGAGFLFFYGFGSLRSALRGGRLDAWPAHVLCLLPFGHHRRCAGSDHGAGTQSVEETLQPSPQ